MQVTFPAMQGDMGGRVYYATIIALSEIPRFFKFHDWQECSPELRAQRVMNESRVPIMAKYMVDNEDSYLFSSITASYSSKVDFVPLGEDRPDIGSIKLELENMEFIINDGQHRCAAIAQALKQNPHLGKDRISVLLFPMESIDRMQQMFSDLNRFAQRSSKSLNILYDHRDRFAALTNELAEEVATFRGLVDMERVSIPIRSEKLFALSTLYDATKELIGTKSDNLGSDSYDKTRELAIEYWTTLCNVMTDWKRVSKGLIPAAAVRQEKISTHATVLRALGGVGRILMEHQPEKWPENLKYLSDVDWRKSVGGKINPMWDGVCISAGSVIANRQARHATLETLCRAVQIPNDHIPGQRRRGRPRKAWTGEKTNG